MPYYLNPVVVGTKSFISLGDGYTMNIAWYEAFPDNSANKIAYHIYYSTDRDLVFSEGVKYVSIDGSLEANIVDLKPGQEYFGAVRPVEYDPVIYNLNLLPLAYDNLRVYPSSVLREDISATQLTIPLMDITDFPTSGIIKIGVELIEYTVSDYGNNDLILSSIAQRGLYNTIALPHDVYGFDGYSTWSTQISIFTYGESFLFDRIYTCQSRFEYPNFPMTILDGYRQETQDILHTDLSGSDEQNTGFPMYDYSGYHRTDPVQLLSGVCVGSYIGGEMGCIDGYGNVNKLRGMDLQSYNTQRQELGLSITGRPAVLLQRSNTGITCACYLESSEYADDRCPFCFVPGTLVRTKNGYKPIEEIKIGELVLSHDGNFHRVSKTYERNYSGNLHGIMSKNNASVIYATPEHPFMALASEKHGLKHTCSPKHCNSFIKNGDGSGKYSAHPKKLKSGKWYAKLQLKNKAINLGVYDNNLLAQEKISEFIRSMPKIHQLNWTNASQLKIGDWLQVSYPKEINDFEEIIIPEKFLLATKPGKKRIGVDKFKLDNDFLWIAGMFIAEGSSPKGKIQFSIHENEILFKNKIVNYFKSHGYNPSVNKAKGSKGINIVVCSIVLSEWFTNLFGRYSQNKSIPEQFMFLPEDKTMSLINGIFDGDGCKTRGIIKQTSKILAMQLIELLNKFNKNPINNTYKNSKTIKGTDRKDTYSIDLNCTSKAKRNKWSIYGNDLVKIHKTTTRQYDGKVYNLEIEETNTYVVDNIVVHNCNGTKFVSQYEQYFNPRRSDGRILVRVGPADENTKMYESGLESELPLDIWTLTVPTIKTRDVIILFDVNNNEEFRYEVTTVTRNNTILGMEGNQKLRAIRIRKTDPAYQVRAFRDTSLYPAQISTGIGFTTGIPPHTHKITKNEKDPSTWSQTTTVSQGHSHQVIIQGGLPVVIDILNHGHTIVV